MELVNRKAEEKNLSPLHNRFSSTTTGTTANIENGMPKKKIFTKARTDAKLLNARKRCLLEKSCQFLIKLLIQRLFARFFM